MRGFEFLKLKIQINFLGVRLPRFLLLYWSVLLGSQRYVQQQLHCFCVLVFLQLRWIFVLRHVPVYCIVYTLWYRVTVSAYQL